MCDTNINCSSWYFDSQSQKEFITTRWSRPKPNHFYWTPLGYLRSRVTILNVFESSTTSSLATSTHVVAAAVSWPIWVRQLLVTQGGRRAGSRGPRNAFPHRSFPARSAQGYHVASGCVMHRPSKAASKLVAAGAMRAKARDEIRVRQVLI